MYQTTNRFPPLFAALHFLIQVTEKQKVHIATQLSSNDASLGNTLSFTEPVSSLRTRSGKVKWHTISCFTALPQTQKVIKNDLFLLCFLRFLSSCLMNSLSQACRAQHILSSTKDKHCAQEPSSEILSRGHLGNGA